MQLIAYTHQQSSTRNTKQKTPAKHTRLKRNEPKVYSEMRHVLLPGSYVNYWRVPPVPPVHRALGAGMAVGRVPVLGSLPAGLPCPCLPAAPGPTPCTPDHTPG
jgi:hypothetical protein